MASRPPAVEMFAVVPYGRAGLVLERRVVPRRGRPYIHRCPLRAFESIAHAVEELGQTGFTIETLSEHERQAGGDPRLTRIAVVLAFLHERGIIDTGPARRSYATTDSVHLDALTEFHALAANA